MGAERGDGWGSGKVGFGEGWSGEGGGRGAALANTAAWEEGEGVNGGGSR